MAPVNEFENYFIPQNLPLLDITRIHDEDHHGCVNFPTVCIEILHLLTGYGFYILYMTLFLVDTALVSTS